MDKDINVGSLWLFNRREKGFGSNKFHGNFIPEIPIQLISRYTKENETVWDCFGGSGTTLDVCKKLNRKCIINDLTPIRNDILRGDSRTFSLETKVQLVIIHPPYHNIIRFSDKKEDLSNFENNDDFLREFEKVIFNVSKYLDDGRILAVIIGDIYKNKAVVPLSFHTMNIVLHHNYRLKGIIIKNIGERKGIYGYTWWRALQGGYYVFEHEYVFVFQKLPVPKNFKFKNFITRKKKETLERWI